MRRVLTVFVAISLLLGCSASGGDLAGGAGTGGSGAGGFDVENDGELPAIDGKIEIEGGAAETVVSGQGKTVQFHLFDLKGAPIEGAEWSTDDTRIGSIGNDGVLHLDGYVGGVVEVTVKAGGGALKISYTVNVEIVSNLANVGDADRQSLEAGGTLDSAFRWLYPYDGTVFPRGIRGPEMQAAGTNADSTFVRVSAPHFSFKGYGGKGARTRFTLPDDVWRGLSLTVLPPDQASVQFSKLSQGAASGPLEIKLLFAPQSLKGIIYYSTYNYPAPPPQLQTGAILRIKPGRDAELVKDGCTVCHTVSANGKVLASGVEYWANGVQSNNTEDYNSRDSATFDLDEAGGVVQRYLTPEGRTFSFIGLTPDGAKGLSGGIPTDKWPPLIQRGVRAQAGFPSSLVDTKTGATVASPSLSSLVKFAQTPAFSPDGKHVAFVNGDKLAADANVRTLSMLDFDGTSVFSNLADLYTTTETAIDGGKNAIAWPSFLPDNKSVLFHEGDSFDSSKFIDPTSQSGKQYAEIRLVDSATEVVKKLEALNGRAPDGSSLLPYGEAAENEMNYEPSALPVAVGGYYWVMFTSRRAYGNTVAPGGTIEDVNDPWGTESKPSARKKIWVAAIDVDTNAPDPSHPAFYLPGQDIEYGNMRAYAAMAPCKPDGQSCESGSDCCGGFCRQTSLGASGEPILECVPKPDSCSNLDELCVTAEDCCDGRLLCLNGRCAQGTVVK